MKSTTGRQILGDVNDCDGSLRDIYVNGVELEDWNSMLRYLVDNYSTSNSLNRALPLEISEIIAMLQKDSITMSISVASDITVNCHFFISELTYDQIELDYDPKEVQTEINFQKILDFIKGLGDILHKKVIVTPENCADIVILEYNPNDGKTFYLDDNGDRFLVQNS